MNTKRETIMFFCFTVILLLACNFIPGFKPSTDLPLPSPPVPDNPTQSSETGTTEIDVSGLKLAFTATGWAVKGAGTEIFLMNPDGTGIVSVSNTRESDVDPAWSRDGKRIAFASKRDGNFEIYVMDANGGNQIRLTDNPARDGHPTWSPNGSKLPSNPTAMAMMKFT